jgi:hypothetical protein
MPGDFLVVNALPYQSDGRGIVFSGFSLYAAAGLHEQLLRIRV